MSLPKFRELPADDLMGLKAYYHLSNESLSYIWPALIQRGQARGYMGGVNQEWNAYVLDDKKYGELRDAWVKLQEIPDFDRFIQSVGSLRREWYGWPCMFMILIEKDRTSPHGVIITVQGGELPA